jgi:hypothetical protein
MCCCGCASAVGILQTLAWCSSMVDDGVLVAGRAVGTAVVQVVGECCLGDERELLAVLKLDQYCTLYNAEILTVQICLSHSQQSTF